MGKVGILRLGIINRHPDLKLCAICDVKKTHGPEFTGYDFYENYPDLLKSDIDAVFVATLNKFSPEIVVAALQHHKHVFCEKPPGRTVSDVEAIQSAEKKSNGCVLKFGFNHRYHGAVMEAKKIITSGEFGKILWMRGIYGKSGGNNFEKEWRNNRELSGGGILLDQGIHMLDLFRYFMGDFSEIKSFVKTAYWDIDVEDNAFALMRTRNNQVALLHSSSTQWKHTFLLEIYLENGYVTIQGILSQTRSYGPGEKLITAKRQFEDTVQAVGNPAETITAYDQDRSWDLEVDEFVQCIKNHEPVKNGNSADALQVMKLVQAVYADDPKKTGRNCPEP
jgi:predicted dehydrogenase